MAIAGDGRDVAPERRPWLAGRGGAMVAIFALLALFPLTEALGVSPFFTVVLTRIMIFAIAALSLDLILGYGALVSFGHAAFLGIGAYAVGISATHGIGDLALQIPVAVLATLPGGRHYVPSASSVSRAGDSSSVSRKPWYGQMYSSRMSCSSTMSRPSPSSSPAIRMRSS